MVFLSASLFGTGGISYLVAIISRKCRMWYTSFYFSKSFFAAGRTPHGSTGSSPPSNTKTAYRAPWMERTQAKQKSAGSGKGLPLS